MVTRGTSPDMATVFHAWLYGRFIEIQSNLRRKKLHRKYQGSDFLGGSFTNRDNVRVPIQFKRETQPSILNNDFCSRTGPSTFTSIAPVLLDWSDKISWVFPALKSTSYFLPQSIVFHISDSSSEANSSFCHRLHAWSGMELWGAPALTGYSCEDFPFRTTQSCWGQVSDLKPTNNLEKRPL